MWTNCRKPASEEFFGEVFRSPDVEGRYEEWTTDVAPLHCHPAKSKLESCDASTLSVIDISHP